MQPHEQRQMIKISKDENVIQFGVRLAKVGYSSRKLNWPTDIRSPIGQLWCHMLICTSQHNDDTRKCDESHYNDIYDLDFISYPLSKGSKYK